VKRLINYFTAVSAQSQQRAKVPGGTTRLNDEGPATSRLLHFAVGTPFDLVSYIAVHSLKVPPMRPKQAHELGNHKSYDGSGKPAVPMTNFETKRYDRIENVTKPNRMCYEVGSYLGRRLGDSSPSSERSIPGLPEDWCDY
jgi:hypothetical protein